MQALQVVLLLRNAFLRLVGAGVALISRWRGRSGWQMRDRLTAAQSFAGVGWESKRDSQREGSVVSTAALDTEAKRKQVEDAVACRPDSAARAFLDDSLEQRDKPGVRPQKRTQRV